MGDRIHAVRLVPHESWRPGANGIIVAQTTLGVTARAQADIDALAAAKKIVFNLENESEALLLRVRSDGTVDDDNILQLYLGRKGDHYLNIGQLTATQGTQEASDSTYFAGPITPTTEVALFDGEESDQDDDSMSMYYFLTLGFDRLVIIASTLASTTVYVDIVGVSGAYRHSG